MKSTLLFAVGILLVIGILFARERLKLAFKVGSILYLGLLIVRFAIFARADPDNLVDLATILAVFGLVWLAAWGLTTLAVRYRRRRMSDKG